MKFCYKVCTRKTMVRSLELRPERVLKGKKVKKERVVPLTRPRTPEIGSRLEERERLITWKANSRRSNPLVLTGESKTGEEAEAWLLDVKKYLQIYDYSSNMKV